MTEKSVLLRKDCCVWNFYKRKVAPFLFLLYFFVLFSSMFIMIKIASSEDVTAWVMSLGVLAGVCSPVVILAVIYGDYFLYDSIEYDDQSLVLTNRKNILNKRIWKCRILYKDIAQVRMQWKEPYKIILNDGSVFELELNRPRTPELEHLYFDIFKKIHLFFSKELNMSVPLCLPDTYSERHDLKMRIRERPAIFYDINKIIVAREDNFEEINYKTRWDGLVNTSCFKSYDGIMLPITLAFVVLVISAFLILMNLGHWFWILIFEGSITRANSIFTKVFFTCILVPFLLCLTLYKFSGKMYDNEDLHLGQMISDRYVEAWRKELVSMESKRTLEQETSAQEKYSQN